MSRIAPAHFVIAFCAIVYCAFAFVLGSRGYVSASNMDLFGHALLANEGLTRFDGVVSTFPPLPHVLTIVIANLFPGLGVLGPTTIAAILAAFLVGAWFSQFSRKQFSLLTAFAITCLLAFNPLMLRAIFEGPGFVLLHIGLWMTALGVFGLRRGEQVTDIILVALGVAFMTFAHPFGIVMVFSLLPFLALVIPPDRLRDAPSSMFLVILFPLIFAVLSFFYVNWVFADGPMSFIGRISRESASLGPISESSFAYATDIRTWAIVLIGIAAVCPIGISMFLRTKRLAPLRFSIACLFVGLLAAAILAALYGLLPSTSLVVSLAVTISAACVAKWPAEHRVRPELKLILAGFLGGVVVAIADPTVETQRLRSAIMDRPVPKPDKEIEQLGSLLRTKTDILFDAHAAPAVIAERGTAFGVLTQTTPEFRFAALRQRTAATVIVVRNRNSVFGSDRIGRVFPDAYDKGFEGYTPIFDGKNWRVYSREVQTK